MDSWDAQKMVFRNQLLYLYEVVRRSAYILPSSGLDKYIYDYFVKKGCPITAEIFAIEANVADPQNVSIESPEGFLKEWWDIFYEKYCSNKDQHAQDPNEAAQDIGNLAYHIPSAVPASSPHSAKTVPNVMSHMVPAFHLRTPEDEAVVDLRFLEMDHSGPSQRVPFVIDPSCLVEQSPKMPQQWEAKDEGEGRDIHFEKTTQMEPNANAPKRATLPMPDPFEAGCSIGSSSGMKQTPES